MTNTLSINPDRLLGRLHDLGQTGRTPDGRLCRVAGSDADKAGRDMVVGWMKSAGLFVEVDAIGNIFGTWRGGGEGEPPIMMGSHLDTVVDAGIYDGSYGVLAGLEVVETLRDSGAQLSRPITVAAFTNEEGVRFTPDMMGSLVHCGALVVEEALASSDADGRSLGGELKRIGYAGAMAPGQIRPATYLELHIEQGPILEHEGQQIGAVGNLQGISWQRLTIRGQANHAGTTPLRMRRDAGFAAAQIVTFLHSLAEESAGRTVATVGMIQLEPNVINVIPGKATLTIDLRDADEERLAAAEMTLAGFLSSLARDFGVEMETERLARFQPVSFDPALVSLIESAARARGLAVRRMTSGAGHDAQMMARIAPAAMIFVPSVGGISHSPHEHTAPEDLVAGANVLLDVVSRLTKI